MTSEQAPPINLRFSNLVNRFASLKELSGFVDADSCVQRGQIGEHDGENRVGNVG